MYHLDQITKYYRAIGAALNFFLQTPTTAVQLPYNHYTNSLHHLPAYLRREPSHPLHFARMTGTPNKIDVPTQIALLRRKKVCKSSLGMGEFCQFWLFPVSCFSNLKFSSPHTSSQWKQKPASWKPTGLLVQISPTIHNFCLTYICFGNSYLQYSAFCMLFSPLHSHPALETLAMWKFTYPNTMNS